MRLLTDESFTQSRSKGRREQEDGHDQRLHIIGRLSESIFKAGDRSEDFTECNKDIAFER
jgi:hypothetical protein